MEIQDFRQAFNSVWFERQQGNGIDFVETPPLIVCKGSSWGQPWRVIA
jgi:hypothetical protein